jgi:HK97 family phage major capsid protein
MSLRKLQADKARLVGEMRSLIKDGQELSPDQAEKFDSLKSEVERLEQRIDRQAALDDLERRAEPIDSREYQREVRDFSLLKAIAGASGLGVDDSREREINQELAKRYGQPKGFYCPLELRSWTGISTTVPAAGPGSNVTPVDYRPELFIEALRAKLVIRELGATILGGLSGKVEIPRAKASGTAYWVAEGSAVTVSDLEFEKATLSLRTVGALSEITRNMLLQSSPDVEQLVKNDFAALLAEAVDKAAIQGTGSGDDEPLGVFGQSGIQEVDVSDGWTWAAVLEFIEKLELENSEGNAWLIHPSVVKTLRSTAKESGVFVADGDPIPVSADYLMDSAKELASYPVKTTKNVPANQACFGRWSDLLLGMFGPMDILVNPYSSTAYAAGNVQVRMLLSCDTAVRHAKSFCIADLGA